MIDLLLLGFDEFLVIKDHRANDLRRKDIEIGDRQSDDNDPPS